MKNGFYLNGWIDNISPLRGLLPLLYTLLPIIIPSLWDSKQKMGIELIQRLSKGKIKVVWPSLKPEWMK